MLRSLLSELPDEQTRQIKKLLHGAKAATSRILPKQQLMLRTLVRKQKKRFIQRFYSYSAAQLESALAGLGIQPGDTLLVHSSFKELSGFSGSLASLLSTFIKAVGDSGNLMMVSLPYTSYTRDYLKTLKCFDVRKTPSRMGLISESFRRSTGVLRSLHPTHPVLARGPKAKWIVEGHENCTHPCGIDSPYGKLAQLHGKVLFFDTSFYVFTFYHYLEELVKDQVSFPLYAERPYQVPVMDYDGNSRVIPVFVFSEESIRRRRPQILRKELKKRGLIHRTTVGNSELVLVSTDDAIACVVDMAHHGSYFYSKS